MQLTALLLLVAILFTAFSSCGESCDTDPIQPEKPSIKELHYDNQKIRSPFCKRRIIYGGTYDDEMKVSSKKQNSSVDFESAHAYLPIDDVTIDVYYGWCKTKMKIYKLMHLAIAAGNYLSDEYFRNTEFNEKAYRDEYTFTPMKNSDGKYTKSVVTKPDGTQDIYGE